MVLFRYLHLTQKKKKLYSEINIDKLANFLVNKKINIDTDIKSSYLSLTKTGETDHGKLQEIINLVINENTSAVAEYKNGKLNVVGFLVGQVMRRSQGMADPKTVQSLLAVTLSTT